MLLVEKPSDGVAVVTLNRPEAMNALSKALRAALQQAIVELDADPEVRVIVLTGAGERAFTAGLDLKELSTDPLGMGAIGFGQRDEVGSDLFLLRAKEPELWIGDAAEPGHHFIRDEVRAIIAGDLRHT